MKNDFRGAGFTTFMRISHAQGAVATVVARDMDAQRPKGSYHSAPAWRWVCRSIVVCCGRAGGGKLAFPAASSSQAGCEDHSRALVDRRCARHARRDAYQLPRALFVAMGL